ncbi:MAG: radical SAM protein [Candidatus Poseidoniaceae archaeon]|jgi:radical SAM superfamily enzyme with C-terminal helix-hairpin-helix motif|nr:radical SAM protein [Candidatus Poseidoniaceae archaeon]
MDKSGEKTWLVIDGYEDEPAAFGVPPYIGFHIRYICGVLEKLGVDYEYKTIDSHRLNPASTENRLGVVILAGAVVPGKYLRGTPISLNEIRQLISSTSSEIPILAGGWAIRGWKQQGWNPLKKNLFLAVQDTDATLSYYFKHKEWKHKRRTSEEWTEWAHAGASSKAVTMNPDLHGPLTYEVEVYQGCVRYKRGCKFCIEPKKGVPIWRSPEDIIDEVKIAHEMGVQHVRLGGMTDTYTYMADGVVEMEYPIPNPEPIAKLLHGLREDERLKILHTDNANPSIIAEHLEESEEITKTLIETLSDGAVLSFGLESADPNVHEANWLNCNSGQLKTAISLINKFGRERGERGLPKLLPGLNFIAGLHGETSSTYKMNLDLLNELKNEGHMIRRVNIRQVEGDDFQEINETDFKSFKTTVRDNFDGPLLKEMLPVGTILKDVWWETHDGRTRLPRHLDANAKDTAIHGKSGVTFGRQIGAYPILIGMNYLAPLETYSDIIVTSHGTRSITGIETNLKIETITEKQLAAIPGISSKGAWNLVSTRAKTYSKQKSIEDIESWFDLANMQIPSIVNIHSILN